jgi:signal transduction histidine kinase
VDGQLQIRVADGGQGIAKQEIERVFEKFFRGREAESAHIPGAGLGLSIVDHIVRGHHGRVTIVSAPGSGSTVSIHLPRLAAVAEPAHGLVPAAEAIVS